MISSYTSGNRFIDSLPPDARRAVAAELTVTSAIGGHLLWEAQTSSRRVLFPLDSIAQTVIPGNDGTMVEAMTVGSEGMLCFEVLSFGGQVMGRCRCLLGGRFASIDCERLAELSAVHPAIARALNAYGRATIFSLTQSIYCNRFHSLGQRCAKLIMSIHDRSDGRSFSMTQEHLAEIVGGGRASVALRQERLQADGTIAYVRGQMRVTDAARLTESACFCYGEVTNAFARVLLAS